eukprot:4236387-Pyramimonas_sp.AAC.1
MSRTKVRVFHHTTALVTTEYSGAASSPYAYANFVKACFDSAGDLLGAPAIDGDSEAAAPVEDADDEH